MFGIGIVDDFRDLKAPTKFALQIVAATVVMIGGFGFRTFALGASSEISLGIFSYPVTLVWIVGITNAMNLVDGADGLAGGIGGFCALVMAGIAFMQADIPAMVVAAGILGATAAFLRYNFPPARIFMGDAGAYTLGFLLAMLPLIRTSEVHSLGNALATATLLAIPILDTVSAVTRRLGRRVSIGTADREHLHHMLLEIGVSDTALPVIAFAASACLGAVSMIGTILSPVPKLIVFATSWALCFAFYFALRAFVSRVTTRRRHARGVAEKLRLGKPASR